MERETLYQIGAAIATVVAGFLGYLKASRSKRNQFGAGDSRSDVDLEIVRLRDERQAERDKQLSQEIMAVRKDCEMIISSLRLSVGEWMKKADDEADKLSSNWRLELRDVEIRLRDLEKNLATLGANVSNIRDR